MSRKPTKKKKTVKKNKNKKDYNDSWMFAMLLSVTCLLATSLKSYTFSLFSIKVTFAVFVVPIIIFISNYITKKYGFKDSLKAILISALMMTAFLILIEDLTNRKLVFMEIIGPFITYFISLFINLAIYYYTLTNMNSHKIMTFINYLFTIVINYLLYLLFFYNMVMSSKFWYEYFLSVVISAVMSIVLIYLDSKIKRGIED